MDGRLPGPTSGAPTRRLSELCRLGEFDYVGASRAGPRRQLLDVSGSALETKIYVLGPAEVFTKSFRMCFGGHRTCASASTRRSATSDRLAMAGESRRRSSTALKVRHFVSERRRSSSPRARSRTQGSFSYRRTAQRAGLGRLRTGSAAVSWNTHAIMLLPSFHATGCSRRQVSMTCMSRTMELASWADSHSQMMFAAARGCRTFR